MLFRKTIRGQVAKALNEVIDRKQALFNVEVRNFKRSKRDAKMELVKSVIDAIAKLLSDGRRVIREANQKYNERVELAQQNHVNSILSKIL